MGTESTPQRPALTDPFWLFDWCVHTSANRLSRNDATVKLEPKPMQVLVYLAERADEAVTRQELEREVWGGRVVGYDALTHAITKLRTAFGDDARHPRIIETLPKVGYRLIAEVVEHARDGQTPEEHASADQSAKPSLAVLPFTNISGDPEQEYFADGLSEDITTAVSNTGWFLVAARFSAFAYKGKAVDVRQVGKELGVQYILEGSVRKRDDKIRVTAQLVETATGKHVWANRYDGRLADVFDFQDQITETIVGTVEPEFQRAEAERIGHKRPENMEAYDYLLRGLSYMNKLTPEDTRTALQYFYKAIEKDRHYARAYTYAFWCYRRSVQTRGVTLSKEEQAEAIRLMEAGLKADKDDPVVLWHAAGTKLWFQHDFEGALALIDRSLSIDPNSPRAWNASAGTRSYMGDTETAIKHAEHAIRISPRNPSHWTAYIAIAGAHLQERRFKEAAEAAKKAVQLNDYTIPAHLILAASCAHLGQLDKAEAAIKRSLELNPRLTVSRLLEMFPFANYKNLDAYIELLRKAGLPE